MKTYQEFLNESAAKVQFVYIGPKNKMGEMDHDKFRDSLDNFMQLGAEVDFDGRYNIVTIDGPREVIDTWFKKNSKLFRLK